MSARPLRIAILAHSTNPRGGVVHALELADALVAMGHDAVAHAPDPRGEGFFRRTACSTVSVAARRVGLDLRQLVETRVGDYISHFETPAHRRFDIFHAEDSISGNALATLKQRGLIGGFVRTVHHIDSFDDPALAALQTRAIVAADRHLVVSDAWRKRLLADFGIEATVVGNGVDRARYRPERDGSERALSERLGLGRGRQISESGVAVDQPPSLQAQRSSRTDPAAARLPPVIARSPCDEAIQGPRQAAPKSAGRGIAPPGLLRCARNDGAGSPAALDSVVVSLRLSAGPIILSIGGVEERKNSLRLLEAFAGLWRGRPDARLVIAGGASLLDHDSYRRRYALAKAALQIAPGAVVELGPLPDGEMPSLYRLADVLAFPSVKEGFGLVVLEAMASGLPVVASRIAPFTEYLGERDVEWCDPYDVASIGQAIERALAPPRRAELVARGAEVAARHDWRRVAQAHLSVYEAMREPVHA